MDYFPNSENRPKDRLKLPESSPDNGENKGTEMCVLSQVFNIVGCISIILGAILFGIAMDSYSTKDIAPVYLFGGVLVGLQNFALAVIVDACQKYRKSHKG